MPFAEHSVFLLDFKCCVLVLSIFVVSCFLYQIVCSTVLCGLYNCRRGVIISKRGAEKYIGTTTYTYSERHNLTGSVVAYQLQLLT